MRTRNEIIKDGIILTITSLLLRTFGVYFSSRLAFIAGPAVIGLHSQIMSIYAFAITAAAAGVSFGSMRLISECVGSENTRQIRVSMNQSFLYCLKVSLLAAVILFVLSPFLSGVILASNEAIMSLRILAVALPFLSVSAALHGYFQGIKQIYKSASVSVFEQILRITLTLITLNLFKDANPSVMCLVLVSANTVSEVVSFAILYVLYYFDSRKYPSCVANISQIKKKFLRITMPIALSAMLRSALTTYEHILIPIGLKKFSGNTESALTEYGLLCGMALPLVLYPMALMNAFSSVASAELSLRVSHGEKMTKIRAAVSKGIGYSFIYGIGCAFIIRYFSFDIGYTFFASVKVGAYIKTVSPLIILMYIDHICDGMLKGLDAQKFVMKINIVDALFSVILAIILIPKLGIWGFIIILYACEFFNCSLSIWKLVALCHFQLRIVQNIIVPLACAIVCIWLYGVVCFFLELFGVFVLSYNVILGIIFVGILYLVTLSICGCFHKSKGFFTPSILSGKLLKPKIQAK